MRLIDADKIPKAIYAEDDNITGMGMTEDEMEAYNDGIDEQWAKIKNAPTVEVPTWIPCSERLPNKDGHYLVCVDWSQDNVDVLRWADGWNCFRDFDGNVYRKSELDRDIVIAWMPLPKAWEGETDD